MSGEVSTKPVSSNPCCKVWQEKFSELKKKRDCLRQAVGILQPELEKSQADNRKLKQAYEEEKERAETERVKLETTRVSLEKEVSSLKSEISTLKQTKGQGLSIDTEEARLLQTRVSDGEKEIKWLKELIEQEKQRADFAEKERTKPSTELEKLKAEFPKNSEINSLWKRISDGEKEITRLNELVNKEKMKADSEKKKAIEASKFINKLEQETRAAQSQLMKAQEWNVQLETLRSEAKESSNTLDTLRSKLKELTKQVEDERLKASKEKKRANKEKSRTEEQRKMAEGGLKTIEEERSRAESFSQQLEIARKNSLDLLKEVEKLKEISQKREEEYKREIERQQSISEANKKLSMEQESLTNSLSHQLQESRKKIEELQKQVSGLLVCREVAKVKNSSTHSDELRSKAQLSSKGSNLERKHLKQAKLASKLEKRQSDFLRKELDCLKQEFIQLSARLCRIENYGSVKDSVEVAAKGDVNGDSLQNTWCFKPPQAGFQIGNELLKSSYETMALHGPSKVCWPIPVLVPRCACEFSDTFSGTSPELKSLIGGLNRKLLQSSMINLSAASFSDGQLVASQGKGESITTAEIAEGDLSTITADSGFSTVHSKMMKRLLQVVESIDKLYTKDKKLQLQIKEEMAKLHDMLTRHQMGPAENFNVADPVDGSCANFGGIKGKKKPSHKRKRTTKPLDKPFKKRNKFESQIHGAVGTAEKSSNTVNYNMKGHGKSLSNLPSDAVSGVEVVFCSKEVEDVNYMEWLDLDEAGEEERYRVAVENPVSPTLPVLDPQRDEATYLGRSECSPTGCPREYLSSEKEPLRVLNPTSHCSSLQRNELFTKSDSMLTAVKASDGVLRSDASFGSGDVVVLPSYQEIESKHESDSKIVIMFSDLKDRNSVSRMYCAITKVIAGLSLVALVERMLPEIVCALKKETGLSIREKACVLLSILLWNFSLLAPGKVESLLNGDSLQHLDSFVSHMRAGMFTTEMRSVRDELLEEMLGLLKSFVVDGRIILLDRSPKDGYGCDSEVNLMLNGVNIRLSCGAASAKQLLAGSAMLASICDAIGYIELLFQVSYMVFLKNIYKIPVLLSIIHVLAHVAGERFLLSSKYRLTMAIMKSIVVFLEGCQEPGIQDGPCICISGECPFSDGVASLEVITSFLLEILMKFAPSEAAHNELISLSDSLSKGGVNLGHEDVMNALRMDPAGSGCVQGCAINTVKLEDTGKRTLCNLSDVFSLVELLASCVGWNWSKERIVQPLLGMLDVNAAVEFSVGIVVLLGQLGRLGVDASGYDDKVVEDLRLKLTEFLWRDTTLSWGLPIQIATVDSLLRLLPEDFGTIIQGAGYSSSQNFKASTSAISRWFSHVSREQQDLSSKLLTSGGVDRK